MKKEVLELFKKIKLLILDVDGVLTDGRIVYTSDGEELKFFHVLDGLGVYVLGRMGIPTVIVTAKASPTVKFRARDMGVQDVFEDAIPKTGAYEQIKKKYNLDDSEICFVGDDLVDLPLMKRAGLSVAVKGACQDIKKEARYVTDNPGGAGAVREVAELILKSQGKWEKALQIFNP